MKKRRTLAEILELVARFQVRTKRAKRRRVRWVKG
jgi:hypothetical protein